MSVQNVLVASLCLLVTSPLVSSTLVTATLADTVYVVSKSNKKLLAFDTATPSTVATLLSAPALQAPSAIAKGSDGNLYIAEWGNDDTIDPRISRYNPTTQQLAVVTTLNFATQSKPSSLTFRPSLLGGELLVGRLGAGPILKVSGWNGGSAAVADYTSGLALDGSLGLAVAADGTLYVSNTAYNGFVASGPIVSFNASGAFIDTVATASSDPDGLSGPTGLLLSGSGQTLYSTSVMNGKIFATTLSTVATTQFATTGSLYESGPIAQLSDGSLLVGSVSGQSNTIYQFSSSGAMTGTFSNNDFGTIGGILVAPVPEPSSLLLVMMGMIGTIGLARVNAWRSRHSGGSILP